MAAKITQLIISINERKVRMSALNGGIYEQKVRI